MKTAYVASCNLPNHFAHAVQIMKNAQAWQRNSSDFQFVSNLTLRNWLQADQAEINRFYGISDRFPMKLYPYLGLTGKRWLPFSESYYRLAARFLQKWGAEIVFTRTFVLPKYSLDLNLPTLVETHGPPENTQEKNDLYELLGSDYFLGIVTISDKLKEMYVAHGLPAEKILTAPDGADLSMFSKPLSQRKARTALGYETNSQYVLYVGHLYSDRGIQEILETARALPDVSFIIVGGHPEDVVSWHRRLASSELDNVEFKGFVNNNEVPAYLWMADVLLMPYSKRCPTAEWMSPLKMFEYMASGRAIVASDLPAIRNVLDHGETAWLVAADDAESLTEGVQFLLADTTLRDKLAENSKKLVQQYSWDSRVKGIMDFARVSLGI